MDEKQLKTSLWQRVVILVIAFLLLGSTVLTYMFIVMSGDSAKRSSEERLTELQENYDAKAAEAKSVAASFADNYFKDFQSFAKAQVKSYNAVTANNEKLKAEDLKVGTGKELQEGDTDYAAYYIGWCPDGSVFDSSYAYAEDDTEKEKDPVGLQVPLAASSSMIEGWTQGVVGMKLGGVRKISIPGELAYGETRSDICDMSNAPLKFVVMLLNEEDNEKYLVVDKEVDNAYYALYTAMMGSGSTY